MLEGATLRRSSLAAAVCGSALAAAAVFVVPAGTALAVPTSQACLNAQQSVNAAKVDLQDARNQLASDKAKGATKDTLDADRAAVSQAQAKVNERQAVVTEECGTSTPPKPVTYRTCAAVHAAGLSVILRGQPGYRLPLDTDRNGIACDETTVGTTTPATTYRYIDGQRCKCVADKCQPAPEQPPVTVVQQPPATVVQQAPQVVTVPAPAQSTTVVEQPAPVYSTPVVPSGPADTGR